MKALVVLALVALATAGCGGGSGGGTTATGTTTDQESGSRSEFVAVADTICRNHQSRREDLESQARDLGPITSKAKARRIAALLRKESRNRRAEARELEALQAPPPGATAVLVPIRAEANLIERWARAYHELDSAAIRNLQIRLGLLTAKAAKTARSDGL